MGARWKLGAGALAAAMSVAVGLGAAAPSVAGAAVRPAPAKPVDLHALFVRQAREFLSRVKIGPMRPGGVFEGRATGSVSKLSSTNWSGYADVGAANSFTSVSASWVQPTGTCTSTESLAAFWVGIDGISNADPTVEQDGTIIECLFGIPFYADWWETYPGNAVQVQNSISAGDHITAKVVYANGKYKMTVTDHTNTADSFSTSAPCGTTTCENMSAEWIAEAPCCSSGTTTPYPLAEFGTWKSSGSRAVYDGTAGTITGVGAPTVDEITMVDSSKAVKAQPTALNSTGGTFSVRWKSAT
jgi:hypothetical protein